MWVCKCSCGDVSKYFATNLRRGLSKNCLSCLSKKTGIRATKHGKYKTKAYSTWQRAKNRCENPFSKDYHLYGGRGIHMCREWVESFEAFYAHMGERPEGKYSIDRIDNDKGYEPGNCRWVTDTVQANNKRNNALLTLGPCTLTLNQWAFERPMVSATTLRGRLKRGWSPEKAILTPVKKGNKTYTLQKASSIKA